MAHNWSKMQNATSLNWLNKAKNAAMKSSAAHEEAEQEKARILEQGRAER